MATKGSVHQEDKIILNLYTLNNMPSKNTKQIWTNLQEKETNSQNERFNNWKLLKEADFKN